MPTTWREDFTVTHAALGRHDGAAYFPRVRPGSEDAGLCVVDENGLPPPNCDSFDLYTVDTYVSKVVEAKVINAAMPNSGPLSPTIIDVLSVDVEGFDWDVLGFGSADNTLKHVKYLEFEYHFMGSWAKYNLSDVTLQLWETHNI